MVYVFEYVISTTYDLCKSPQLWNNALNSKYNCYKSWCSGRWRSECEIQNWNRFRISTQNQTHISVSTESLDAWGGNDLKTSKLSTLWRNSEPSMWRKSVLLLDHRSTRSVPVEKCSNADAVIQCSCLETERKFGKAGVRWVSQVILFARVISRTLALRNI